MTCRNQRPIVPESLHASPRCAIVWPLQNLLLRGALPNSYFPRLRLDSAKLAATVKVIVNDKVQYTDWSQRDDIKAELKVGLILLLTKHSYPSVDRNEVYQEIFEQAEKYRNS